MTNRKLSPWLVRSSVLAIGVSIIAFGASAGMSQSFNGTYQTGTDFSVDQTVPGVTNVTLNAAQAVINWTPDGSGTGDINFQAAGTTANFNRLGGGDFAVLNRIVPTDTSRAIRLDGNIRGWVGSSAPTTGGTIFFYSPGGIIIGSTARIDVGSLGLTTADPEYTGGNFISESFGQKSVTYREVDAARSQSAIVIEPTSVAGTPQINALNDRSSYVTLFAPVIRQNGIINVNGSAALVAASAGTITWNDNGLFNVEVTTGTAGDADGIAIEHGGNTGGTISGASDGTDSHRVYLVAVPKNTAITTLIKGGSSLGFDVANAAVETADGVILSSGYDLYYDDTYDTVATDATGAANIVITNATFRSSLGAYATGNVTMSAEAGGTMLLWGNLVLDGRLSSSMTASGANSFIDARSNVSVYSQTFDSSESARVFGIFSVMGSNALLEARDGAQISILGDAYVDASVSGMDATGGTATVRVTNGGSLQVGRGLYVRANANDSYYYGDAGFGQGGTAQMFVNGNNSSVTVTGDLEMAADGFGAEGFNSSSVPGGDGYGGTASIEVGSGAGGATLSVGGNASLSASGSGAYAYQANGGNGSGGMATISVLGSGRMSSDGRLSVSANGSGGVVDADTQNDPTLFAAGSGQGGTIDISVGGTGGLVALGGASLNADGQGGGYYYQGNVTGGDGFGGTVGLGTTAAGATIDLRSTSGKVSLSASGRGGFQSGNGNGGNGTGGTASITGNGGTILLTDPSISVFASGAGTGFGGSGVAGNATGGQANLILSNGAEASFTGNSNTDSAGLVLIADAQGGDAQFSVGGGNASAGGVDIQVLSGATLTVASDVSLSAQSLAGLGGGSADGRRNLALLPPSIRVLAEGGEISFGGPLEANADAVAGNINSSTTGGRVGGAGYAGSISILSNSVASGASSLTLGNMELSAVGTGGRASPNPVIGGNGAAGGVGSGGQIVVTGQGGNGALSAGSVNAVATGKGGDGNDGDVIGGAGGVGNGGSITIGTTAGLASSATSGGAALGDLTLNASATGGTGGLGGFSSTGMTGAGGAAYGGTTRISAAGSTIGVGDITLNASATGGSSGDSPNYNFTVGASGNATAGLMEVIVTGRAGSAQPGALQAGLLTGNALTATGTGGSAGGLYYGGGPVFSVANGSVDLTGLSLIVDAQAASPTLATPAARLALDNGSVTVTGGFTMRTPGTMSVFANQSSLSAATLSLTANNFVADLLGTAPATPGTLSANSITINSANDIIIAASLNSQSLLSLAAPGSIFAYDLTSATSDISVVAGGGVTLRNLSATGLIDIDTPFALSIGTAQAGGNILLDAGGAATTAAMQAGDSVVLRSGGAVQVGGLVTAGVANPSSSSAARYDIGIYGLGSVQTGDLQAAGRVGLIAGTGSLTAGVIRSTSDVLLLSGGNVTAASINSTGNSGRYVYIANSSMVSSLPDTAFDPAPLFATTPVAVNGTVAISGGITGGTIFFANTGALTSGDIRAVGQVSGTSGSMTTGLIGSSSGPISLSGGTLSFGALESETGIVLNGTGSITTGAVRATNGITITSSGIATLGTINVGQSAIVSGAGGVSTGNILQANGIEFTSTGGSVSLGSVNVTQSAVVNGATGVTAGNVTQANNIQYTSGGGNVSIGTVNVAQSAIANGATGVSVGNVTQANNVQLTSSGGNVSFGGGTVNSLVALTANNGLLTISGNLSAPSIFLRSSDIAIGSGLRIDAGDTGQISLYSTNAQGMRIGDGTSGSGYLLDKAEFATLNSGSVSVGGIDTASRVDMTIGDLEITGPLAGSTIDDPNGTVTFFTGNPSTQAISGTIRITGSVRARGFLNTNGIVFNAGVFELDANTGLLEILGQGGALVGTIFFNAPRIHVAESTILDRLAQNPLYAGRGADLNTPLANARPDGVVRSGSIDLGEADAVLVQNTGTRSLPAGFLTTGEMTLDRQTIPALGSVDLIINGQLQTTGGLLTQLAVRDFLIDGQNRPFFTPESSINGCSLDGACTIFDTPNETPNQILQSDNLTPTRTPDLGAPEIQGDDTEETPEERRLREQAEKETKSLPIPPPTPLINTQPLNPVTDLDEPVSGSGNPSLIGDGTAGMTIGKGNQ